MPFALETKQKRDPTKYYSPLSVSCKFGLRVRQLRTERKWTQLGMAQALGIDRSFISDLERGRKSPSLPTIEVIALGMKISLSDLLDKL